MQINLDESKTPWFVTNQAEIPVRLVKRVDEYQWQQEVEQELAYPFDWSKAPLARVVLLKGSDASDIIITCDHIIADGKSVIFLLRDILQAIESPGKRLLPLSPKQSYEKMVKSEKDAQALFFTPSRSIAIKPKILKNFRPYIHTWSLSKEETITLINKSSQAQTSVHAAICAAFLLTIAERRVLHSNPRESAALKCLSPIDIRKFLPLIEEDFGYYFTTLVTTSTITPSPPFWELARSIKEQLNQKMIPEKIFAHLPDIKGFASALPDNKSVVNTMEATNGHDILITNLGQLAIPHQYGKLSLATIYGPSLLCHVDQDLVVGIATLHNQMFFTLTYSGFEFSQTQVLNIQKAAMLFLRNSWLKEASS